MKRLLLLVAVVSLVCVPSVARGAIHIQGSTNVFTGPGIYTFDFVATAVGENYTIQGFTIPLLNPNGAMPLPEDPDTSLSDIAFTPNPFLELRLASSDFTGSGFGFSISAEDANGSPLVIDNGQSVVLFSIPVMISTGPSQMEPLDVLTENGPLATLQTITLVNGSVQPASFGAATFQAIPEPSAATALACGGLVTGLLRRRRRR